MLLCGHYEGVDERVRQRVVTREISVGDFVVTGGELPAMLKTLASLYETASRARMKRMVILIEPITILLIGGMIGFIMVAIMLAISSLSNVAV